MNFALIASFLGFLTIYIDHSMKWIEIGQMDQNELYRTICINDGPQVDTILLQVNYYVTHYVGHY